jgi:broad specificity polyphosphatase/5'/3'-nucleotidase SurE
MNYFLPVHCGAPDYNKSIQQFNSSTLNSQLGPYLAGLFEGNDKINYYSSYQATDCCTIRGNSNYFKNTNELVLFGTNLGSSIGNGRITKRLSQMYVLHKYPYSVVIGLMLSDG